MIKTTLRCIKLCLIRWSLLSLLIDETPYPFWLTQSPTKTKNLMHKQMQMQMEIHLFEICDSIIQYNPCTAYSYVFAKVIQSDHDGTFVIHHLKKQIGPIHDHHRLVKPIMDSYSDNIFSQLIIEPDGSYYDSTQFYEQYDGELVDEYDPLDWQYGDHDIYS